MSRKLVNIIRTTGERCAPRRRMLVQIAGTETRHDDAIRLQLGLRQPPADDIRSHQGRDLNADIANFPCEIPAHFREYSAEPSFRQMTGQEENSLRHVRRALTASTRPLRDSTTVV